MLVSGIVASSIMVGVLVALFAAGAAMVALDKRYEAGRHD